MIDKKIAEKHLIRLSGLDYFPKEAAPRKELLLACEVSFSEAILESVISDWIAESTIAPKPAELRRMLYDRSDSIRESFKKCARCAGTGVMTIWILVTYQGQSFTTKSARTLPDVTDYEQADQFTRGLAEHLAKNPSAERQTVLSAAKNCGCRMAA